MTETLSELQWVENVGPDREEAKFLVVRLQQKHVEAIVARYQTFNQDQKDVAVFLGVRKDEVSMYIRGVKGKVLNYLIDRHLGWLVSKWVPIHDWQGATSATESLAVERFVQF